VPKNDLSEKKQKMRIVQKIFPLKIRKISKEVVQICASCLKPQNTPDYSVLIEMGLKIYIKVIQC